MELEIIQMNKNPVKKTNIIATVETVAADLEFDPEELEAINAIRTKKGQPPYPFWKKINGFFNDNKIDIKPKCQYCNYFGHMQKECNKSKAAGASMVDAIGKT
jgi:hypothetical protein